MRCCGLLALLPLASTAFALDSSELPPIWSLRAGFQATPTPQVRETISTGTGSTSSNWGDEDGHARRFHVGGWHGVPQVSGLLLGVEVSYAIHSLGDNQDYDGSQSYRQAGVDAFGGWQWGMTGQRGLRGHVEVTPFLGGGYGWLATGDAEAPFYEYGLRAGAFIDERDWTAGILLSYLRGASTVTAEGDGVKNTLDLTTSGFRFGFEAGYNF
jgi:hypothetical protein